MDQNPLTRHGRLSDPHGPVPRSTGTVRTGSAAAAEGRAFLVREYGSLQAVEAELRRGRPPVGQDRGASPTVRGRVSPAEHEAFRRLQRESGRSQSELVREAVHDLLVKHQHAV